MSDYTQRVREFARLNGRWLDPESDQQTFMAETRRNEAELLDWRADWHLRRGENSKDPEIRMRAVSWRAHTAQQLAAERTSRRPPEPATTDPSHQHQALRQPSSARVDTARTPHQPTRKDAER
jgi:hypothetical protein